MLEKLETHFLEANFRKVDESDPAYAPEIACSDQAKGNFWEAQKIPCRDGSSDPPRAEISEGNTKLFSGKRPEWTHQLSE